MSNFRFPLWFVRDQNPAVAFTNSKALAGYRFGRQGGWKVDFISTAQELMVMVGDQSSKRTPSVSINPDGDGKAARSSRLPI